MCALSPARWVHEAARSGVRRAIRPEFVAAGAVVALAGPAAWAQEVHPWQVWHPEPVSTSAESIENLHLLLFWIMVAICAVVFGLVLFVIVRFRESRHPVPSRTTHNTLVEVVWTVAPVIILVAIAIPCFRTLYTVDRIADADLTIKATGYQWYWGYE